MTDKEEMKETQDNISVPQETEPRESMSQESGPWEATAHGKSVAGRIPVIVITCILALSIGLCLVVIVQVLSRGYATIGGYSLFRVVTGSMEPEIPVGALLIAKETEIEQIQTGDIVTFRSREQGMLGVIITHRVKAIHTAQDGTILLETKGDANQYADGYYAEAGNLVGKVIWYTGQKNPLTGIFGLLTNKVGFLACIVLPCMLFGVIALRDSIGELRNELEQVSRELAEQENKASHGAGAPQMPGFGEPVSVTGAAVSQGTADSSLTGQLSEEEYRELCERLKKELLEELTQSVGEDQAANAQHTGDTAEDSAEVSEERSR